MLTTDFDARVQRVAALYCVGIKELSLPHVSRLVRESGAKTDDEIYASVTRVVKAEPIHFDLKGPKPMGSRDSATDRLALGNRIAAQERAEAAKAAPVKLTAEERDRVKRWGGSYGLGLANRDGAQIEPPQFIDESNDDQG